MLQWRTTMAAPKSAKFGLIKTVAITALVTSVVIALAMNFTVPEK